MPKITKASHWKLSNHLGNVMAVVSDNRLQSGNTYVPDVINSNDYYAFGGQMPGRTVTLSGVEGYRYGFNGKENDNEVKGAGNQQDYGMRIYDPRIAKFLSVDPLTKEYPWYTPYQFAGNKPINSIDLDGLEEYNSYDTYSLHKGKSALRKMDGSDGAWLTSDRIAKNGVWFNAMSTITQNGMQDKFRSYFTRSGKVEELAYSFGIVRDYYNSAQGQMDSRGFKSRWAIGASYLVDDLAKNFDGGNLASLDPTGTGGLLKDLNQGIANYAVTKFKDALYGTGIGYSYKSGYEWDKGFIQREQGPVAFNVYSKWNGTLALRNLNRMSRNAWYIPGGVANHFFPDFSHWGTDLTNDNASYRYGQQDRINIPLFMLWPKTHGSQSGVKLNDKQTSDIIKAHNSINNYYKNNMK